MNSGPGLKAQACYRVGGGGSSSSGYPHYCKAHMLPSLNPFKGVYRGLHRELL